MYPTKSFTLMTPRQFKYLADASPSGLMSDNFHDPTTKKLYQTFNYKVCQIKNRQLHFYIKTTNIKHYTVVCPFVNYKKCT